MARFLPCGVLLVAIILAGPACASGPQRKPANEAAGPRWYKGNLHTHSLWSDGDDFPEMIVDWYKSRGYDFLALSDHNTLQAGDKWVKFATLKQKNAGEALDKYRARFPDAVQTRGDLANQTLEIRLQPLAAFRKRFDEPGKFLLVQSEEITDAFETKPIHMNATNIGEVIKPQKGTSVREVIEKNLRAVREQSARLNRPILIHLNHPNFGWGVTAEDLAAVVEERFFEVYNGHPAVNQQGDETHLGIERLWDVVNTIRLAQLGAEPVKGLGTDDSHHYHVLGPNRSAPGRGWVMVRAVSLDPASLIKAMEAGDFYASSGVTLKDVRYSPETKTIDLEIEPDGGATFTTQFVGTPVDFEKGSLIPATATTTATTTPAATTPDAADAAAAPNPLSSDKVGMVFATVQGSRASYKLTGNELYVRAVVTSSKPPESPSYKGQLKQAWTQPVGWVVRAAK